MKIFANKSIWKKIIIAYIFISVLTFAIPQTVQAAGEVGGVLAKPIVSLFVAAGDGIVNVLHQLIVNRGDVVRIFQYEQNSGRWLIELLVPFVAIVFVIIAISAGGAWATFASTLIKLATVVFLTGTYTTVAIPGMNMIANGIKYTKDAFAEDTIAFPFFSFGPEEIFENKIDLFKVNIFDENIKPLNSNNIIEDVEYISPPFDQVAISVANGGTAPRDLIKCLDGSDAWKKQNFNDINEAVKRHSNGAIDADFIIKYGRKVSGSVYEYYVSRTVQGQTVQYTYRITKLLEGNITGGYGNTTNLVPNWTAQATQVAPTYKRTYRVDASPLSILQNVISVWYVRIMVLAIIIMLPMFLWTLIRLLIPLLPWMPKLEPQKQADYREKLWDWFCGLVLIFGVHYVMIFENFAVDKITDSISGIRERGLYVVKVPATDVLIQKIQEEENKTTPKQEILMYIDKDNQEEFTNRVNNIITTGETDNVIASKLNNKIYVVKEGVDSDGKPIQYVVMITNLMGRLRIDLQTHMDKTSSFVGYAIMYIAMVGFTLVFSFTYLKRVVLMYFLTVIAPLVALTYVIDKMQDGKAQGFMAWLREYTFNLLLQPAHYLIYIILVSSAIQLATSNILYAMVALYFIGQAETLLRGFFNFSKASTPGAFSGAAGAALAITGMQKLFGMGTKGSQPPGGGGGGGAAGGGSAGGAGSPGGGSPSTPMNASIAEGAQITPAPHENSVARDLIMPKKLTDFNADANLDKDEETSTFNPLGAMAKGMNSTLSNWKNSDFLKYDKNDPTHNKHRIIKGLGRGALGAGQGLIAQAGSIYDQLGGIPGIAKTAGGAAAKFAGMAAGAGLGAAAGIVSSDAKTAGGAMLGLGLAGGSLSSSLYNNITDNFTGKILNDPLIRNIFGEEKAQEIEKRQKEKKLLRDEASIKYVMDQLKINRIEAQEKLKIMNATWGNKFKIKDLAEQVKLEQVFQNGEWTLATARDGTAITDNFKNYGEAQGREKAAWGYAMLTKYSQYYDSKTTDDEREIIREQLAGKILKTGGFKSESQRKDVFDNWGRAFYDFGM